MIYYGVIFLTYIGLAVMVVGIAIFLGKKKRLGKILAIIGVSMFLLGFVPLFKFISSSQEKAVIESK